MAFESVKNHYETLVFTEIQKAITERKLNVDDNFLDDVACVALNHLPSRYVRHEVDLAFFLTTDERKLIENSVKSAVGDAISFVEKHHR